MYTVSQEMGPDIFDCILKKDERIFFHFNTANVSKWAEVRAVGGHRSGEMKFSDFFASFSHIFRLLWFFLQVVQKQTLGEVVI